MYSQRFRVYYEDTDASGVMYHARYLAFFERARTECLRAAGFGQQALMDKHDLAFTISKLAIQYRRPARLDDMVELSVILERIGPASVIFAQAMTRVVDDELLATAQVKAGCVQCATFRATRIPDSIRLALDNLRP